MAENRSPTLSTESTKVSRARMITQRSKMLFAAYRKDDFADPDGFALQLCAVLEKYPDQVIMEATDPLSGLQRTCKFPPTIAEVVEFCESSMARIARIARYSAMGEVQRLPRPKQHRANVFVPPHAPQYARMLELAKTGDPMEWRWDEQRPGIWVALGWLDVKVTGWKQFTKEQLEAIYRRQDAQAAE